MLRYLSYSFYGAWILLSVTGVDLVSLSGVSDAAYGFLRNYMLSGVPLTICLIAAGLLDSFFNRFIAHGPLTVIMAIIASVSTFIVATGSAGTGFLGDIAMMGTGLGTAFVCLRVGLVTSRLSGTEACFTISNMALMSFLIYFAVKGMPVEISMVLLSCLPFASVFCSFCIPDAVAEEDPLSEAIAIEQLPKGFFTRLILAVCAFALAAGVVKGIGAISGEGATTSLECFISIACVAGFVLVLCLVLRTRNFNVSSLYLPIGLLMSLAMIVTPMLGSSPIVQSALAGVLYNVFIIIVWCLLIDLAGRTTLTPTRVFGLGRGASALGTTVGVVAVFCNQRLFSGDSSYYIAYLAVMGVILAVVFTMALPTGTIESALEVMLQKHEHALLNKSLDKNAMSTPAAEGSSANARRADGAHADAVTPETKNESGSLFDRACAFLADEAKLTRRETEVFALLARGRTVGYIADELIIAPNTAKGYVKNVYAKLGVHSRQELIDTVESAYSRV